MKKKVFVSGCYDMLHSGHVAFFEEASTYGDLYVGIGSDSTIYELKGRKTIHTEDERLYMVKALKAVTDAWVNSGSGLMDFEQEVEDFMPDIFFVNQDGNTPDKRKFCDKLGIEYVISNRIPHANLPARSTTDLRQKCNIPFRIDLAGGWLDQPYVSKYASGPVITTSIEPDYDFNDRSGMSTSTRRKAIELWQTQLPPGEPEQIAKILFSVENPPGSDYVSGSQDAIGIVMPGANYLWYNKGKYWPNEIMSLNDNSILDWLESRLYLSPLNPRKNTLHVTDESNINKENAQALSVAAKELWTALNKKDSSAFGKAMTDSFKAQIALFPNMVNEEILTAINNLPETVLGYKLSGAGGGGYLVLFSEEGVEDTLRIRIRRGNV